MSEPPAALKSWQETRDFLTAGAEELIEGQYADRPQLRPVLDAVLAVLPALGPVTVQARRQGQSDLRPGAAFAPRLVRRRGRTRLRHGPG